MNPPTKFLLIAGVAAAALGSIARGEEIDPFAPGDGPPSAPVQVQVQVEFVEMSHADLTKLLFLSTAATDATELRKSVQEMVAKNQASVLETQIVVAKSGQKGTTDCVQEFIYPTEFTPVSFDEKLKKAADTVLFSGFPANPATPTAFDTRNIGSKLEVEPTVDDEHRTIDLRFVPEIVWHSGNRVWHEGKDPAGNPFKIQMPDIYSLNMNTSIVCLPAKYMLAGVVSPKNANGEIDLARKIMVFAKCDILVAK